MTCGEFIEYLMSFSPDDGVSVVICDPERRLIHKIGKFIMIDETPALFFEIRETKPMDEIKEI